MMPTFVVTYSMNSVPSALPLIRLLRADALDTGSEQNRNAKLFMQYVSFNTIVLLSDSSDNCV